MLIAKLYIYHLSYNDCQSVITNIFVCLLIAKGIYVIGFSYPVVPKDQARIRVQISAAHTEEDIDRTVAAFIEVGKSRNVI